MAQPLRTSAYFLAATMIHSHCRGPAEESETGKSSADLLLPFLRSAGAMVLNLLGAQLHNKASAHFTAPEPAQGQGETPYTNMCCAFDSA